MTGKVKVKICGITRESDAEVLNATRPDYAGFVFAPSSRRYVSPERARVLRRLLCRDITTVGVFVREPVENIVALVKEGIIGAVQLHGGEDEATVALVRSECGVPVIKAFSIGSEEDVTAALSSHADFLLLDNGAGGTGKAFDWSLLTHMTDRRFFIAGGINPENVGHALSLSPYAVDVSSGVETNGCKDAEKIKRLIQTVRRTEK